MPKATWVLVVRLGVAEVLFKGNPVVLAVVVPVPKVNPVGAEVVPVTLKAKPTKDDRSIRCVTFRNKIKF